MTIMRDDRKSNISTAWGWVGALLIAAAIAAALGAGLWYYFQGRKETYPAAGTPQSELHWNVDRYEARLVEPATALY
jgi:predicted MFS family arabinose efflux permease